MFYYVDTSADAVKLPLHVKIYWKLSVVNNEKVLPALNKDTNKKESLAAIK